MDKLFKDISGKRTLLKHVVFLVVAALMSYHWARLRWIMTGEYGPGSLEALLGGTADKVFQYRALVPWLVGLLGSAPMATVESWLSIKSILDWFRVVEMVAVFLLVVAFRYYISLFLRDITISFVLPFLLFYPMFFNFLWPPAGTPVNVPLYLPVFLYFPNYVAIYYPYDMPSMMFFTVGLILLYKRKWAPYYLLFAVATLNRETTCFLTFVYLFTAYGRDEKRAIALHCGSQLLIWAGIKYLLSAHYSSNPGQPLQNGLFVNLELLSTPSNWYFILGNMGFLWLPALLLWRHIKEDFVRRSLLVFVPFLIVNLFVGQYTELRGFGEMIPVAVAAFIMEIKTLFRGGEQIPRGTEAG